MNFKPRLYSNHLSIGAKGPYRSRFKLYTTPTPDCIENIENKALSANSADRPSSERVAAAAPKPSRAKPRAPPVSGPQHETIKNHLCVLLISPVSFCQMKIPPFAHMSAKSAIAAGAVATYF